MRYFLVILSFTFFIACQKEQMKPVNLSGSNSKKIQKTEEYDFSNGQTASMSADEFADLKSQKDDEADYDNDFIEEDFELEVDPDDILFDDVFVIHDESLSKRARKRIRKYNH